MIRLFLVGVFSFCCICPAFAQKNKWDYIQFDVSVPLRGNENKGETDANGNTNNSWFLLDGLSAKLGYGIHYKKWVALGAHTGIDWKGNEKLVAVPVFANLRISPEVVKGTRMYIQAGYGKSFALGRGNLSGIYKKYSLGLENNNDYSFFIEYGQHRLIYNNVRYVSSVSLGIALTTF
jgi:hypothetical protein